MSALSNPSSGQSDPAVFVITGGGRGIGAAVVNRLAQDARRPIHLIVNYVSNRGSALSVKDQAEEANELVTAEAIQADVAEADQVARMFQAADAAGTLAGLVNNAAITGKIGSFLDLTPERIERVWAINITGSFLCAQEAIRRMSTNHGGAGGSIVNVSSRAASFGSPNEFIDYAASKGALDSLTKGLSTEFASHGIRVNAVRPGLIDTDIHAAAGQPDRIAALAKNVPLQRGGKAEEVANLICWLLSEESSYMTGALVDIGGGR